MTSWSDHIGKIYDYVHLAKGDYYKSDACQYKVNRKLNEIPPHRELIKYNNDFN